MVNVILIDDEEHALVTLEHLLKKIDGINILAKVQDSRLAKEIIIEEEPDLIFLDIEMPYLNGFELLEQIKNLDFKVVFTTAYDQYAVKAFKLNALDYLLKPIDFDELKAAVNKYKSGSIYTTEKQITQLFNYRKNPIVETLALSTLNGLEFVNIKNIMYAEAQGAYANIVMNNNESHLISKTLSSLEEILQDTSLFFRSHKSSLVNLNYIDKYIRGNGGDIIMTDGKTISLSRQKKDEFLQMFKKI